MEKTKHEELNSTAPVMPCQNSLWIRSFRIYGEGRTQIALSLPATIGPLSSPSSPQLEIHFLLKI